MLAVAANAYPQRFCRGVGDQPNCTEPLLRDLSGAIYYDHCEDNSFFCWSTNIVLAFASLLWCAQESLEVREGNSYRASVYFCAACASNVSLFHVNTRKKLYLEKGATYTKGNDIKAAANAFASAYHCAFFLPCDDYYAML